MIKIKDVSDYFSVLVLGSLGIDGRVHVLLELGGSLVLVMFIEHDLGLLVDELEEENGADSSDQREDGVKPDIFPGIFGPVELGCNENANSASGIKDNSISRETIESSDHGSCCNVGS